MSRGAVDTGWFERCEQTAAEFAEFVRGKSVVLVGPAASLSGRRQGAEIDAHDLVIRINLSAPVPPDQCADLGSRTDALYHVLFNPRLARAAGQAHTVEQIDAWRDDGVRFVVTRQQPEHDRVRKFRRVCRDRIPLVCMSAEFKAALKRATGTNPNTGTLAIAHLLSLPIRSLHVTGFDFYQSAYQVGYGGFDAERAARGTGEGNWGLSGQIPHAQDGQVAYLAGLKDVRLSWDAIAAEALGLADAPPPVTAIVPMKGESERLPGKNVRDLCGRPLLFWALDALHRSRRVTRVVVDTDSDEIEALVRELHPATVILRRPDHLLGGHITGNPLTEWALTQLDGDYFLQTHVTNPLLTSATIDRAIDTYFTADDHDSLFAVTRHYARLFDSDGEPVNHDPSLLARSQDLAPLFEDNSNLYVFSRESFARAGRVGKRPQMFEMDRSESIDIDWPDDFVIAEALMARRLAR